MPLSSSVQKLFIFITNYYGFLYAFPHKMLYLPKDSYRLNLPQCQPSPLAFILNNQAFALPIDFPANKLLSVLRKIHRYFARTCVKAVLQYFYAYSAFILRNRKIEMTPLEMTPPVPQRNFLFYSVIKFNIADSTVSSDYAVYA